MTNSKFPPPNHKIPPEKDTVNENVIGAPTNSQYEISFDALSNIGLFFITFLTFIGLPALLRFLYLFYWSMAPHIVFDLQTFATSMLSHFLSLKGKSKK